MRNFLNIPIICLFCFLFLVSCSEVEESEIFDVSVYNELETPCIIDTVYPTDDVVIADIIVTQEPYNADPTGETDSTEAIRKALNDCAENGGGTVFLPVGVYMVTETIQIPAFVTLRGDWQDPDVGTEYGTVIKALPESTDDDTTGLFRLGGSGGVVGLTVFYPEQWVNDFKKLEFPEGGVPYSFTFYTDGVGANYMLSTVKNVTVLNGYRGIGACTVDGGSAHEQLTVENFKGTFLYCGAEVYNQADVGTWQGVSVSPKYWMEIPDDSWMKTPSDDAIKYYINNYSYGLILGDLEWTEFKDLKIDGCRVGINIVKGKRIEFAGSMYDISVTDCEDGIIIDAMDDRWGMILADSFVEGRIVNNSFGLLKMSDVEVDGEIVGSVRDVSLKMKSCSISEISDVGLKNIEVDNSVDLSAYNFDHTRSYVKPISKLYIVSAVNDGSSDVSSDIQNALDDAGKTGGVVYVPAGMYRLDNPISVPANVELRGSSSVANRCQGGLSLGTVILSYYGDDESYSPEDTALITLSGENSGLNGVRIVYPQNGPYDADLRTTYTVRGKANGVYVVNSFIIASAYGVDFRNCDDHFIKKVTTCCYYNTYLLGGKNGYVSGCLQNGNAIPRGGVPYLENWLIETNIFTDLFDPILRLNCRYIVLDGAESQTVYNTFAYGCANLIVNRNSENSLAVNIGSDNIGSDSAQLVMESGSFTVINSMRYNGHSYDRESGNLKLYNRITINDKTEEALSLE